MRYIRDQLIQIDPAPGRFAFLDCVAHVLDDLVGAMPVCYHVDEDVAQDLRIFLASVNKALAGIGIGNDG
jgi:hypothetical protein